MAIFINTNPSALNAVRYMNRTQSLLNTTYQRLASGLRINSAKDDAAGLQIADRMTAQINGLTQGNRNAADGIALAQTMEGGMDEITNMLQEMRTLAIQAATGSMSDEDRAALQKKADSLAAEITRIAQQTKFGGEAILDGAGADSMFSAAQMALQIGANTGDTVMLDAADLKFESIYGAADIDIASAGKASDAIDSIDAALAKVDAMRADLGATQNRLESAIRNQENVITNQSDARARIQETDYATEIANLTKQTILQQMAASMLMQANTRPQLALSLLG